MLEWILRGKHELAEHNGKAIFLTLTYKPKHLPREGYEGLPIIPRSAEDALGNLRPEDMTLFLKKLRKYIDKNFSKRKIKYIYCGEYGEKRHRPHYHIIIYGLDANEIKEEKIQEIWGLGKVVLDKQNVTEHGIQYVVGYCSKKILNKYTKTTEYYQKGRLPPFLRVSKGIGEKWALKNKDIWTKTLSITVKNGEAPVPRYYIKVLRKKEGFIIKYTKKIANVDASGVIKKEHGYELFINPNGYYTKKIYNKLKEQLENAIIEAEENVSNKYYFEDIGYQEERLKRFQAFEKQRIIKWEAYEKLGEKLIKQILFRKTFRKPKDNLSPPRQRKEPYIGILSKEYITEEKDKARYTIEIMLKGKYGKRQKMEIMQELNKENI